tara:strand:+ start:766 stop:1470 length:705 start_codon:yes stop_codon:yes gene_type:complete
MPGKEGWYPGKHIGGLFGKLKEHHAKFKEGGEYGLRTGDQQAEGAFQDASAAANEGGVGQENPALNEISRSASTGRARQMSQDFDASDPDSVLRMQQQLNRGGYTDRYGNALEEDGKMGELTTGAMRKMQGDRNPEAAYEARGQLGVSGDLQNEESARLNLRGAAPVTQPGGQPVISNPDMIPPSSGEESGGRFTNWLQKMGLAKKMEPRGGGTNRFGTPQGGRFQGSYGTGPE